MSTKHLGKGSSFPEKKDDKLRVYSMKFCPFAQRARMILIMKNIPHEIINIDTKNKPEWITKIHPQGKVPAIDNGKEIIVESTDIAEWLDVNYPEPPLYSDNDDLKNRDKELVKKFGEIIGLIYQPSDKSVDEKMKPIYDKLDEYEEELKKRETPFFLGNTPGMLDYMIWPWCERIKVFLGPDGDYDIPRDRFPTLNSWRKLMVEMPGVKETVMSPERHATFFKGYLAGAPDFEI